jgi:hypothetical protein
MKYENLNETVALMNSSDYKDRFKAEFYQVETRCEKLKAMLDKYIDGKLPFTPTCPYNLLHKQYVFMCEYLECLKERAILENVEL